MKLVWQRASTIGTGKAGSLQRDGVHLAHVIEVAQTIEARVPAGTYALRLNPIGAASDDDAYRQIFPEVFRGAIDLVGAGPSGSAAIKCAGIAPVATGAFFIAADPAGDGADAIFPVVYDLVASGVQCGETVELEIEDLRGEVA